MRKAKTTEVNCFKFSLKTEHNPWKRAAIAGLYRVLTQYKYSAVHERIRPTATCYWNITDDTDIEIHFDSISELDSIVQDSLGDFTRGIAISPGFSTDPMHEEIGHSINFSQAVAELFQVKKGSRWMYSTTKSKPNPVRDPVIDTYLRINQIFLQQMKERKNSFIPQFRPDYIMTAVQKEQEKQFSGPPKMPTWNTPKSDRCYGTLRGPLYGAWYDESIVGDIEDLFLTFFIMHAFVYVQTIMRKEKKSEYGLTGIGIQADTFTKVDALFTKWLNGLPTDTIDNIGDFPLWVIATRLRLPSSTYPVVSTDKGHDLYYVPSEEIYDKMENLFSEELSNKGKLKLILKKADKPLIHIISNRLKDLHWWAGNMPIDNDSKALDYLVGQGDTDPMEKEFLTQASDMFRSYRFRLLSKINKKGAEITPEFREQIREKITQELTLLLRQPVDQILAEVSRFNGNNTLSIDLMTWTFNEIKEGRELMIRNMLTLAAFHDRYKSNSTKKEEENANV